MTDAEMGDFLNKTVRATLADGRVLVGRLKPQAHGGSYVISTAPVESGPPLREHIQSAAQITELEDLTGTPEEIEGD